MSARPGAVLPPARALLRREEAAVAIAAYAFGPRTGAAASNALHSHARPAAAALWAAHIGLDRALGCGLNYPSGFGHTPLGRLGRG